MLKIRYDDWLLMLQILATYPVFLIRYSLSGIAYPVSLIRYMRDMIYYDVGDNFGVFFAKLFSQLISDN